jgi:putative oxidoreductase
MFQNLLATTAAWFTLPIRLALGLIFIGHGAQKVFGAWGGPGWAKFTAGMEAPFAFMRPSWLWLAMAAIAELVGGVLVLLGLLTRVGAFFLAVTMLVAMLGVHWGAFFMPRGIEYTVALLGMSLALLVAGGGRFSVDERLQAPPRRRW